MTRHTICESSVKIKLFKHVGQGKEVQNTKGRNHKAVKLKRPKNEAEYLEN